RGAEDGHVAEPVAAATEALLDGMRARRAGAAEPERRPFDAALDADMRGGGRADEPHERQWVAGRLLELEDMPIGDLQIRDAALGGAENGRGANGIPERNLETRLLYGLIGRRRRKQAVAVGAEN